MEWDDKHEISLNDDLKIDALGLNHDGPTDFIRMVEAD